MSATVTARFGPDGITLCDPNRAGEGAAKVFLKVYEQAICPAVRHSYPLARTSPFTLAKFRKALKIAAQP